MICYVFIGIQGSGKGTQALMLSENLGYKHINTGDLFRSHINGKTDLGNQIREIINRGDLVPDELVFKLVDSSTSGDIKGLIFDGFPRTLAQAEFIIKHFDLKKVFYLELDEAIADERITTRRICSSCPENYNLVSKPPKIEGKCDYCGSVLVIRKDDEPETVKRRFSLFFEQTKPLISLFRNKGVLKVIKANQSVLDIFKEVLSEVELI
jgi:adenylate kinase